MHPPFLDKGNTKEHNINRFIRKNSPDAELVPSVPNGPSNPCKNSLRDLG
jgi:hypothetical protein